MSDGESHRRSTNDRRQFPPKPYDGPERRKSVVDRRMDLKEEDKQDVQPAQEKQDTGLEQNRGPGKRLAHHARAADKGEMTDEQFLFLKAIEAFKRVNQKAFPTWTDVLEVVRKLGYRKTMESELHLNAQDWTEAPDAPAFYENLAEDAEEEQAQA